MISLGLPFLASVPFFSEWLSLTFNGSHDPCVGKRSDLSRGDGSGRMEDGEEEEGKGLIMWFCVGQDCPPLLTKSLLGGGLFWAFEDNDGDSARLSARRRVGGGVDDGARPLARRRVGGGADNGACPLARRRVQRGGRQCSPAGATTSRQRRWCSPAGATTSRWRGGRRCSPVGATTSRRRCPPVGVTTSWRRCGQRCLPAGTMTSRRRGGRQCSLAGATTSRQRGGRLEDDPQRATIDTTINSVWSSGSRTACCRPREC